MALTEGPQIKVYIKTMWGHNWQEAPTWTVVTAMQTAAPEMSSATFKMHYGSGTWEDYSEMADGANLESFNYLYVQVRADEKIIFTGLIPAQTFRLLGESGSVKTADQIIQAYGLDWLLESRPDKAWVQAYVGGGYNEINSIPTFNRRYEYGGNIFGNRSTSPYIGKVYDFSRAGELWTNYDIIEYLLYHYQYDNGPQFALAASGARPGIGDIYEMLEEMTGVYDINGVTVRQALNALMPRNRGLCWTYEVDGDDNVTIIPLSLLDEEIVLGTGDDAVTIPANTDRVSLDLWDDPEKTIVTVNEDITHTYDKIVVRGNRMKSCCTLTFGHSSLEKAWSNAEEAAYKDAAKNITGYDSLSSDDQAQVNDACRATDRFLRVFTTFRVPFNWEWIMDVGDVVNPKLDPETGELKTNENAPFTNADKILLSGLPLQVGFDYGKDEYGAERTEPLDRNPDYSDPEFRSMFVLVKDNDDRYQYAEKLNPTSALVRPLSREMGFEMRFNPAYTAAYNHWLDAEPAMYPVGDEIAGLEGLYIDYEEILATVFIETDQFVQLAYELGYYENMRVLTINIPDAELWYITPGTIVDADDAGEPVEYGCISNVLRDDRDRLRLALVAAVAWYGKRRNKITIDDKRIKTDRRIGELIIDADIAGVGATGAMITNIAWDFGARVPTTTVRTDFTELDIPGLFRAGVITE